MQQMHSDMDEDIDLRGLIHSLLSAKWWVIGVTVGLAVLAFVYTQVRAVKAYQASTMVVFGQSPLDFSVLDSALSPAQNNAVYNTTAFPDPKGILDLATLNDIFISVYQSPELAESRARGLTLGKVKQESNAQLSGNNQIILQVTDPDPKRAVLLANLWAKTVADRLNTAYGPSSAQVSALEQQVKTAQQAWDDTEKALIDQLAKSNVDSLSVQLGQAQTAYAAQLGRLHNIDLELSDARALNARMAGEPATASVSTGDAISLLALQQRASDVLVCNPQPASSNTQGSVGVGISVPSSPSMACTSSGGVQIQLSGTDPSGTPAAVADAQQDLKLLMDSLQAQQEELNSSLGQMDAQLGTLRSQMESAQYEVDQLTARRDAAKASLLALSLQLSATRAQVAANDQAARVIGEAGIAIPVGSKAPMNAFIAGAIGFIVVCGLVLLLDWWRNGSKEA